MQGTLSSISLAEVWVPLFAALLGGFLSLLGTYWALMRSHALELQRAEKLELKNAAQRAYEAFHKLHNAYETAANLQRQITEMFDTAAADGGADMEPWAKVKELIGSNFQEGVIEPSETSFLISARESELLNDVHLSQKRIWNISASAQKYNELRSQLVTLLEKHHITAEVIDGHTISAEISGQEGVIANVWENRLQNLLGQIIEYLDTDTPEAWETLGRFKEAAEKYFGEDFPEFRLEKAR